MADEPPRYRRIADDIRARIASGEYPPGSRLPSKAALMDTHGVALGTVDHAIDVLRSAGLIETVQGTGTFVCDPLPDERPAPDGDVGELADRLESLEVNLMDLYGKLGFDYPRDGAADVDASAGAARREHLG